MKTKRILAMLLAVVLVIGMLPMVLAADGETAVQPEWPNKGAISLNKEAQPVEGTTDTWEVTLTIEGKNFKAPADVVLVIDTSGSMTKDGSTKLADTKKAAKAFGEELLTADSDIRIAVVTYAGDASSNGIWYTADSKEAFKTYIDGLTANGGTNQQAGIHMADDLLYEDNPDHLKNIVLLTDGEPTYSYPFIYQEETFTSCERRNDNGCNIFGPDGTSTTTTYSPLVPDYRKVIGDGSNFTTWYNVCTRTVCNVHNTVTYSGYGVTDGAGNVTEGYGYTENGWVSTNNGVATIWEANQTKAKGTTIYSVALQAGTNGENVLKGCATDPTNGYYSIESGETDVEGKLTSAFTAIAGKIAIAASKGLVTDPMSQYVNLCFTGDAPTVGTLAEYEAGTADVYISQGSLTYDAGTIGWNVGNINEGTAAVMKYKVKLADGVSVQPGDTIPTNGTTTFDYLNYKQEQTRKNFPVPEVTVNGGTILKHYYLVNGNGAPINSAGEVVDSPDKAAVVQASAYFEVDGKKGLNYGTEYTVPCDTVEGYGYYGYALNDGTVVTQEDSAKITLSVSNSNQHVWFAYSQYFTVVHSSDNTSETFTVPAAGDTFDLTAKVKGGYLYGGYKLNDATNYSTESGLALHPAAGDVYYLKEVDDDYLTPKIYYIYDMHNNNKLRRVYLVTCVDSVNYLHVGFDVNGVQETFTNDTIVYKSVLEKRLGVDGNIATETTLPFSHFYTTPETGYLSLQSYLDYTVPGKEPVPDTFFTMLPYYVTFDNVKVTGVKLRTVYIGDGYCYFPSTTQGLHVSDETVSTTATAYAAASNTDDAVATVSTFSLRSAAAPVGLTLCSVYDVDWDAEVEVPEEPSEPVVSECTITKVDGTSTETQVVAPGDQTGNITYGEKKGYVFAGWFLDEALTEAADFSDVQGDMTVYAKYISAKSVGTAVTLRSSRNGTVNLRTTVTVNTDRLREVGFTYTYQGETVTVASTGMTESRLGSLLNRVFGSRETQYLYSADWSLSGLKNRDTFTVTPYWVTLDGTTVEGSAVNYLYYFNMILQK